MSARLGNWPCWAGPRQLSCSYHGHSKELVRGLVRTVQEELKSHLLLHEERGCWLSSRAGFLVTAKGRSSESLRRSYTPTSVFLACAFSSDPACLLVPDSVTVGPPLPVPSHHCVFREEGCVLLCLLCGVLDTVSLTRIKPSLMLRVIDPLHPQALSLLEDIILGA